MRSFIRFNEDHLVIDAVTVHEGELPASYLEVPALLAAKIGKLIIYNADAEVLEYQTDLQYAINELNAERDNALNVLVIDNVLCNDDSVKKMAVKHGLMLDDEIARWIGFDNTTVDLTKSELESLIRRSVIEIERIYFDYRAQKDAL